MWVQQVSRIRMEGACRSSSRGKRRKIATVSLDAQSRHSLDKFCVGWPVMAVILGTYYFGWVGFLFPWTDNSAAPVCLQVRFGIDFCWVSRSAFR